MPIGSNNFIDKATDAASVSQEASQCSGGSGCEWPVSRREFVAGAGVAAVGAASWASPVLAPRPAESTAAAAIALSIFVNGEQKQVNVDPRTSLLDLLREKLKLTGTKKGCDHGQCGACTVLLDGRRINSCLALAVSVDGQQVTTIEGLAKGEELHPVQQAFIENDGFQCGYCTPGQIVSAVALISEARRGAASVLTRDLKRSGPATLTDDEIRERMSGNICRCGAYPGIVAAIRQVSGRSGSESAVRVNEDSNASI